MERLKNHPKVVGLKQSCKAVSGGRAKYAFLAEDTEKSIFDAFLSLCDEYNVPVIYVSTGKELAKACRVEVKTACAVLLKAEN